MTSTTYMKINKLCTTDIDTMLQMFLLHEVNFLKTIHFLTEIMFIVL